MYQACTFLEILLVMAMLHLLWRRGEERDIARLDKDRMLPVRGVLALLVVIGHCDSKVPGSFVLQQLHMSTPAVAVFFFLSGYGLMKSFLRRGDEYLDGFLPRSLIKLGIPLLGAAFVMCICLKLEGRNIDLARRMTRFVLRGQNFPQHSWFVYALAVHYVFFFCSLKWLPAARGICAFAALSVCYYAVVRWGVHWPTVWHRTSLCMSVGVAWAFYENLIRSAVSRRGCAVLGCMLTALLLWHVGSVAGMPFSSFLANKTREFAYLLTGPALALAMYVIRGLPRMAVESFRFLGVISFEMYLLHFVGERNVDRLGLGSVESFIVVLLVTVPMACLAHVFNAWAVLKIGGIALRQRREVAK